MATSGHLNVTVDTTSSFLQTHLPYVVRNARMAVVHTGTVGGKQIELDEGLYSVEVTAPNGTQTTSVVHVPANGTARVDVPAATADSTGAAGISPLGRVDRLRAFGSIAIAISNWKGSSVAVRWTSSRCRHC